MRSDDVKNIEAIAGRVGWEKIASIILDDMTSTGLRRLAGRLSVQFETPDDWAMATLIEIMEEPDALALIERVKSAGVPFTTGQELFAACLKLRAAR